MTAREGDGLKRSVSAGIARILRRRILDGNPKPGSPLREAALAEEFDVSRNTVREALLRLEDDGLVNKIPHRGSHVAAPDPSDVQEILALRKVVEPGAVRRLSDEERTLPHLQERAGAMETAARQGNWKRYGELDLWFHAELVASAGGDRLANVFEAIIAELRLALLLVDLDESGASFPDHVEEHRRLVDAIARDKTQQALSIIDAHLDGAEQRLLKQ